MSGFVTIELTRAAELVHSIERQRNFYDESDCSKRTVLPSGEYLAALSTRFASTWMARSARWVAQASIQEWNQQARRLAD